MDRALARRRTTIVTFLGLRFAAANNVCCTLFVATLERRVRPSYDRRRRRWQINECIKISERCSLQICRSIRRSVGHRGEKLSYFSMLVHTCVSRTPNFCIRYFQPRKKDDELLLPGQLTGFTCMMTLYPARKSANSSFASINLLVSHRKKPPTSAAPSRPSAKKTALSKN